MLLHLCTVGDLGDDPFLRITSLVHKSDALLNALTQFLLCRFQANSVDPKRQKYYSHVIFEIERVCYVKILTQ